MIGGPVIGGPAKTVQGAQPLAWVAAGAGLGLLAGGGFMGKQAYDYHQAERSASVAGDYDAYEQSSRQALGASVIADTCYLAGAAIAAWGTYSIRNPAPRPAPTDGGAEPRGGGGNGPGRSKA